MWSEYRLLVCYHISVSKNERPARLDTLTRSFPVDCFDAKQEIQSCMPLSWIWSEDAIPKKLQKQVLYSGFVPVPCISAISSKLSRLVEIPPNITSRWRITILNSWPTYESHPARPSAISSKLPRLVEIPPNNTSRWSINISNSWPFLWVSNVELVCFRNTSVEHRKG